MSATADRVETGDEALERILARLRSGDAGLAHALLEADPAEAHVIKGPRGARTVSCGGTLLASAYDPESEGRRLAESMDDGPVDLLLALGFGLGHHLEAFHSRHRCPVIVYEPSPARLRAALLARSRVPLLERPDVFLTCDPDRLRDLVTQHYVPGLRMKVFPHPSILRLDPDGVRALVSRLARIKDTIDIRGRTLTQMMGRWAQLTIENVPHLLTTPSLNPAFGALRGVPAVVCAAGPSLDKQLPLLAEASGRVLVIAIGQSLAALHAAGIEPDLVHVVESQDVCHQLERAGALDRVTLVLPPQAHPGLFEVPVGRRLVVWHATNPFGCWIASILGEKQFVASGGTVAQCAVYLAAALGAGPVMLLGQDLAFTGGRVYARSSCYGEVGFERTSEGRFCYTNLRKKFGEYDGDDSVAGELIWVEGWDGDPVPTDVSYASFREAYQVLAQQLGALGVGLWNCTEGGARIPGLDHLPFREALQRCATRPIDKGPLRALGGLPRRTKRQRFEAPLRQAKAALERLEHSARDGCEQTRRVRAAVRRSHGRGALLETLRGLERAQGRVRTQLSRVPFLDALVQPELHRFGARTRRVETSSPGPERAAEEADLLFEATLRGVGEARTLLGEFDRAVAREVGGPSHPAGGSRAGGGRDDRRIV